MSQVSKDFLVEEARTPLCHLNLSCGVLESLFESSSPNLRILKEETAGDEGDGALVLAGHLA